MYAVDLINVVVRGIVSDIPSNSSSKRDIGEMCAG